MGLALVAVLGSPGRCLLAVPQPSLCRCAPADKLWEPHKLLLKANIRLRQDDLSHAGRRKMFSQLPPLLNTTPALDPGNGVIHRAAPRSLTTAPSLMQGACAQKGSIKSLAKGCNLLHFYVSHRGGGICPELSLRF